MAEGHTLRFLGVCKCMWLFLSYVAAFTAWTKLRRSAAVMLVWTNKDKRVDIFIGAVLQERCFLTVGDYLKKEFVVSLDLGLKVDGGVNVSMEVSASYGSGGLSTSPGDEKFCGAPLEDILRCLEKCEVQRYDKLR